MATKRRLKKHGKPIRLKVSSVAKMLGMTMYEVQENAKHFGVTPTEVVVGMLKQKGFVR